MSTPAAISITRRCGVTSMKRQSGMTLMEAMISLALSVVVTSAMVILMANSLGTATRIIHMSNLSDEMRNVMSVITRDVRRANYSAYAAFCYGNSKCGEAGGIAEQANNIQILEGGRCLVFTLDRGFNGNAADDGAGGFRIVLVDDVGVMEMWVGGTSPTCGSLAGSPGWIELTDPRKVNITNFEVNDLSPDPKVVNEGEDSEFTNHQRRVQLVLEGQLVLEDQMVDSDRFRQSVVTRQIEDIIYLRNDYIAPGA
jgi:prepilin peptidase dependent protein B